MIDMSHLLAHVAVIAANNAELHSAGNNTSVVVREASSNVVAEDNHRRSKKDSRVWVEVVPVPADRDNSAVSRLTAPSTTQTMKC